MRKHLMILFVCMAVVFTSFGSSALAADPVKLQLWTHQRHMMDLVQELLDEFNKTVGAEKGIEVSMQVLGDDASNVFLAAQKNQQGPDLYNCPTGYQGFQAEYEAGLKIYWDDMPGFAEWKAQWPDWYWREGVTTMDGHVYAVPFTVYNAGLVYNKDLFKEAGVTELPKTYADVREAAKKITQIEGKYGLAVPGKDSWYTEWMLGQLAEANGKPVYWDWTTGKYAFTNYDSIYQLVLNIQADGSLFPGSTSLNNDALRAQFAAGNIGMFFAENWDVGVLNDQFPAKDDWGVMLPVPTVDGEQHGKIRAFMSAGLWSINAQSKHPEEAWEVVKFFLEVKNQARFYEEGKIIPPNPDVIAKAEKEPTQKGFADFAKAMEGAYVATFLNIPGFQQPPENPCHILTNLLSKGGDVKAELEKMETVWNDALDKFYAENPDVKREWNMYPNFDRVSGDMGQLAPVE